VSVAAPVLGVTRAMPRRRAPEALGYIAAVTLAALAGGIAAAGGGPDTVDVALVRAAVVGVPLVVGFNAWYSGQAARFGVILMLSGLVWFVTVLAETDSAGLYTVGRTAGWCGEILFVYTALAFPHGRLPGRADRVIVTAMALVVATCFLPQLVLAEQLQVPSPYTSCVDGCPGNALFALDTEPTALVGALRATGALLVFTIGLAVVARLWRRLIESRSITHRMLLPVVVVAGARAGLLGVAIAARQAGPEQPAIEVAAWTLALATPVLALAFALALGRLRRFAGQVLEELAGCVGAKPDAIELQRALARAFRDPALRLAFPRAGSRDIWSDGAGRPFILPLNDGDHWVVPVEDRRGVIAALVCAGDLRLQPRLVEAAASFTAMALDNRRLEADAASSMRDLEESRARLATSAERERRRIERDLHDGAQQRLVALRIELELAEELLVSDPEAGRRRIHELEGDVDDALEELRALAHGVYPPLLADRGLAEALRAVAARSPVRVELDADGVGRYPPELESAVYYCVLEALQNALKHAAGARRIVVELDGGTAGRLGFVVRDDGSGVAAGEVLRAGAGITSMRDRVAAFGGALDITSATGVGTTVRGTVATDGPRG